MKTFEDLVYDHVRLIPLGMVTTFAEIARAVGNDIQPSNVLNFLKDVQDLNYIPAHRVVTSDGSLSSSFVDGGKRGQKKYLKNEGLEVIKNKIDLKKYMFYYW